MKEYCLQLKNDNYIINRSYDAVEYLEIFKNMYFEEAELENFYSYVLSKKENQDKKVLVGYNGVDGKEVTMSELREDMNEIRDIKKFKLKNSHKGVDFYDNYYRK